MKTEVSLASHCSFDVLRPCRNNLFARAEVALDDEQVASGNHAVVCDSALLQLAGMWAVDKYRLGGLGIVVDHSRNGHCYLTRHLRIVSADYDFAGESYRNVIFVEAECRVDDVEVDRQSGTIGRGFDKLAHFARG